MHLPGMLSGRAGLLINLCLARGESGTLERRRGNAMPSTRELFSGQIGLFAVPKLQQSWAPPEEGSTMWEGQCQG